MSIDIPMEIVICTICGEEKLKSECTGLVGLLGSSNGWECAECDKEAGEAKKVIFENDSLGERYERR